MADKRTTKPLNKEGEHTSVKEDKPPLAPAEGAKARAAVAATHAEEAARKTYGIR